MNIRFIPHDELEIPKYNGCVHYAYNSNIFGYEWYLKNTVRFFGALVEDDYSSVMPLVIGDKRWGGQGIYLHPLGGRLGIYSVNVLSPSRVRAFMDAIPDRFKSVDIIMNDAVTLPVVEDYTVEDYSFGKLTLARDYAEIKDNYSHDVKEILDAHHQDSSEIEVAQLSPEKFVETFISFTKLKSYEHPLMRLIYNAKHRGIGFPMAYSDKEGTPVVLAYFMYDQDTVYNLLLASQNASEELQVIALDSFLRSHAGRSLTLDFNNIRPGLAEAFGAELVSYQRIHKATGLDRWLGNIGMRVYK